MTRKRSWNGSPEVRRFVITAVGALAAICLDVHEPVEAGGFQITSLCGKCQGRRNAGEAAAADTAATVFYNPAGLTQLPNERELDVSGHWIVPWTDYGDDGSSNPFGAPLLGARHADGATNALVPSFYYAHRVDRRVVLGLGVNAPYGLSTDYDDDWVGRYHGTKSELITVNINPGIGLQLGPHFSVGLGLNALYADTELRNAVDFGSLQGSPNDPDREGESRLKGEDWGYGWNAGLLYHSGETGTRLGVSYRSSIDTTLDGNSTLIAPPNAPAPFRTGNVSASSELELPATLRLGLYQRLNDDWAVLAGATWTEWSSFEEIRVKTDDAFPDLVQPANWRDNWRFAIGLEHRFNHRIDLRGGVEYDRTPIRGNAVKTPRIPDTNLTWLALGLTYRVDDALDLDFAYSYVHGGEHDIRDREVTTPAISGNLVSGNTLIGEYDSGAHVLSAGVRWQF